MKYLVLFFTWLKKTLAKETLLTILGLMIALVLSYITDTILIERLKGKTNLNIELESMDISQIEYWVFLFMFFMLMVYGIRFVESVIKTVLLKPVKKE